MATHHRRVIVVNEPADLPESVATAEAMLRELHELVRVKGESAFAADAKDRILLVHTHPHGEDFRELTVFANGTLELRTTYTSSDKAHAERDYPTPRSITAVATEEEQAALTEALEGLPPAQAQPTRAGELTLHVGAPYREFLVPAQQPSAPLARVLEATERIVARIAP